MRTIRVVSVSEVQLANDGNQPCIDAHDLFRPDVGPIDLLFRKTASDEAVEVELQRALPDDEEPGSVNLSGKVYGRFGCDRFAAGTFEGHYHPSRQTGRLIISPGMSPGI